MQRLGGVLVLRGMPVSACSTEFAGCEPTFAGDRSASRADPWKIVVALLLMLISGAAYKLFRQPVIAPPSRGLANATVLIVRHAEKPTSGPWLNETGRKRAAAYVRYFDQLRLKGAPVHIDGLVAAADRPGSFRSRLTLTPLSRALRLPIQLAFDGANIEGVAAWLKARAAGRTMLVAWHHSDIPGLIAGLGAAPTDVLASGSWPASSFDQIVVLRYDSQGRIIPGQTKLLQENIAI